MAECDRGCYIESETWIQLGALQLEGLGSFSMGNRIMNDLRIKEVFDKLQDDESKMIFKHLLLYYLEGSKSHLVNMLDELNAFSIVQSEKAGLKLSSMVSFFVEKFHQSPAPIIAYGAGVRAEFFVALI